MKVPEKLDQIRALVSAARTLPMSSSIVINKAELLRMLEELGELLPDDLALAEKVLDRRDAMLYEATANAERLLNAAIEERKRMISEEEVLREARIEAAELIRNAQERSEQTSREIDEYVDAKLAHLEVAVTNILDTIRQGRQRLAEPGLYGELAAATEEGPAAEPTPLPRRTTSPDGLLTAGSGAGNAKPEWDLAQPWDAQPDEQTVLPRRGSARASESGRNPDAGAPPDHGTSQQDDAADSTDRQHSNAEPAASAGPAPQPRAIAQGWTPRRPPVATEAEAVALTDEQSFASEHEPGDAPSEDSSPDATVEQNGLAADSQPQEARTE